MQFKVTSFGLMLLMNYCLAVEFPNDIEKCKAEDLECVARTTTQIVNKFPNGHEGLAIPQLDPFYVTTLTIDRGSSGPVSLQLTFKDLEIRGLSKLTVMKTNGFTADPKTSKYEILAKIPKLHLTGKYKANGRILVLPIQGEGNADLVLDNVDALVKFKPTVSEENGKQYLSVNKLKTLLSPKKLTVNLQNLFNGDRVLGDNMNAFINENWQDVWGELSPAVNVGISEVLKSIVKNMFKKFSYDELIITS